MKTTDKILELLKLNGAMTAKSLAAELELTTMGVRQHLQQLEQQDKLTYFDQRAARGRPTRFWAISPKGQLEFPNKHEELTLQMIDSIKTVFGEQGLEDLIVQRELEVSRRYKLELQKYSNLLEKLSALVKLRTEEGYMATLEQKEADFWIMENHCPICSAAKQCQNFCRSELQLFQELLESLATVTREEHILEGARRCAYKVIPLQTS